MKTLLTLAALTLVVSVAQAAPKKSKDPAFAATWSQNAKTYEGKPVTTAFMDIDNPGAIAEDAPVAAIKVYTGNARGDAGGEIIALMAPKDVPAFMGKIKGANKAAGGGFGGKISYPTTSATFATVEGEPVLTFGPVPKLDGKKPSEILAAQIAAATPTEAAPEDEKPADKKAGDKKSADKKSTSKKSK